MHYTIHRSGERGTTDAGWLHSRFSFSFADYQNPKRMRFGALRVLNDDCIVAGSGFDMHPHRNMEIITIVTKGSLTHEDSMGSKEEIVPGLVQVMSAGSGVLHSEFNHSDDEVCLFQLWIDTKEKNITPRYETKKYKLASNKPTLIVSGNKKDTVAFIHQDAKLWLAEYTKEQPLALSIPAKKGLFVFVIMGTAAFEKELLNERDSLEITDATKIMVTPAKGARLLIVEVPMQ